MNYCGKCMRLIIFIGLFPLLAQTPSQITVSPHGRNGVGAKSWPITVLTARVTVQALVCDQSDIAPGETINCTATIDKPAPPGGAMLDTTYPAPLTGPAGIVVPPGASVVTFSVSDPPPPPG